MIVPRIPKDWSYPKEIHGKRTGGYWRSHQVPQDARQARVRILKEWMRSSRPEELFDPADPAPSIGGTHSTDPGYSDYAEAVGHADTLLDFYSLRSKIT